MREHPRTFSARPLLALGLLFFVGAHPAGAQTAPAPGECKVTPAQVAKDAAPPPPGLTSGIQVTVKDGGGNLVKRKRFYLLGRSVLEGGRQPDWSSLPRRADYHEGASEELKKWLRKHEHECDSLYCPQYEAEYAEAVKTVPEFVQAYREGLKKYRSEKLALDWVMVNFPRKNVRTEYYKRKRAWLEQVLGKADKVPSVMTDERGIALFTGLEAGKKYYVSNVVPHEPGNVLWDCAVTVPPPVPTRLHSVSVELSYPKAAAAAPAK